MNNPTCRPCAMNTIGRYKPAKLLINRRREEPEERVMQLRAQPNLK